MRQNSFNTFITAGLKAIAFFATALICSMLLFSNAQSAGLGKLTVLSALGQPLRAEVELISQGEEVAVAKLASPDAYKQANIEFNPILLSLQFAIDERNGVRFVKITSTQPINEPFVDLLLELGADKLHLSRAYTAVFLDPAGPQQIQSAQIETIARSSQTQSELANTNKPAVSERSSLTAASATGQPVPADQYRVKQGDTLARIARKNLPAGISLDQMLVALYRGNTEAFISNNMNRLRSGQILSIPDSDRVGQVSKLEARSVVLAQSKDFKRYRDTLAGVVQARPAQAGAQSKQSSSGKISAKIEEQATPASEAKDKLTLSRGAVGAQNAQTNPSTNIAATEEKIAREKATAEAEARVKALEKNVNDLQKILELKNKSLADLQNQKNKSVAPVVPAPTIPPVAATTSALTVPPIPAAAIAPSQASTAATPAPTAPSRVIPATGGDAVVTFTSAAVTTPPPQITVFDHLSENPLLLPVGGVLAAAILAALAIFGYRHYRARQQAFLDNNTTTMYSNNSSLFGTVGGQSVDTKNSVFNSHFAPSANHLDTNVDSVAEADVYIAYGRDVQAEEILKEALHSQPERNAIRIKLLEIYLSRKDRRAFETVANELYSLTTGVGEDWQQVLVLGFQLDPTNPLYAGGKRSELLHPVSERAGEKQEPIIKQEPIVPGIINSKPVAPMLTQFDAIPAKPMDDVDFSSLTAPTQPQEPEPIPELLEIAAAPLMAPLTKKELEQEEANIKSDVKELKPTSGQNSALLEAVPLADKSLLYTLNFNLDERPTMTSTGNTIALAPLEFMHEPTQPSIDSRPHHRSAILNTDIAPLEFNLASMNTDLDNLVKPSLSLTNEIATKLDLAAAYKEIGDKEGARELLEEILKSGNERQIQEAKELLFKL